MPASPGMQVREKSGLGAAGWSDCYEAVTLRDTRRRGNVHQDRGLPHLVASTEGKIAALELEELSGLNVYRGSEKGEIRPCR
jgi:hypothetical protein